MEKKNWLDLQLFADGAGAASGTAGDGTAEGAATGDNTVDAEQQRLLELGVPADKIRKRAKKSALAAPKADANTVTTAKAETKATEDAGASKQAAAADDPTEEAESNAPTETSTARLSWEEIMADPEYNKQMQAVVQSRLKDSKSAEDTLKKLSPTLEALAAKYGLDPAKLDYDALNQAISEDDDFFIEKALQLGTDLETARALNRAEKANARQQEEETQTLEAQKMTQHFQRLEKEGNELKKTFKNFDLRKELQNPVFARMTSPNVGLSVEDAYYAVHRKEIQTAAMQATAKQTAKKISNAIQAGQSRPNENGTSAQAPSVTSFDYRNASREQREALKREIRDAAARGEKLFPKR